MPRVAVLGQARVGKTSFARALGAARACSSARGVDSYVWSPGASAGGVADVCVYRDAQKHQLANDISAPSDVVVLLFDLARRESLQAVVAQVCAHLLALKISRASDLHGFYSGPKCWKTGVTS